MTERRRFESRPNLYFVYFLQGVCARRPRCVFCSAGSGGEDPPGGVRLSPGRVDHGEERGAACAAGGSGAELPERRADSGPGGQSIDQLTALVGAGTSSQQLLDKLP